MATFIAMVLAAVLTNNFITEQKLGICPFLGVSKKTSSAIGMGVAVTIVMTLAAAVTWPIYEYVMVPLDFAFLEIIVFIFIIASLVQMIEMIIRKLSPSLYNAMGVSAVNFGWAVLYSFFSGLGFTLIMIIMSGMREKLNNVKTAKYLNGFPISMVTASFICMAFTVFSYIG